jgi:hypothetical protein
MERPKETTANQYREEDQVKPKFKKTIISVLMVIGLLALNQAAYSQTARVALETYEEGPVWQIMTFRTAPGKTEAHLKNIATVWEQQLKLAVEKGVLVDYKVLTKWSSGPEDWNIMVVEIFPNMASYDTFWKDWAAIDAETVDTPQFEERFERLQSTKTEFLGTVFAREVYLKPQ